MTEIERERAQEFADKLSLGVLARTWQILLKGVEDVKDLPRPLASAEMALIRLAYASDLPTPEEMIRKLSQATRQCASGAAASVRGRAAGGRALRRASPQQRPLQRRPRRRSPPARRGSSA